MSRWVCKLCIIQHGIRGSDLDQWPEAPADAWIAEHLRTAHGIEVRDASDEEFSPVAPERRVVEGKPVRVTTPEQEAKGVFGTLDAVGRWVPFEERPRPDADLAKVQLTLEPGQGGPGHIIITTADYDQAGRIFVWLMGQTTLARIEVDPATRKDWGFD